jgi:hypothetical protein
MRIEKRKRMQILEQDLTLCKTYSINNWMYFDPNGRTEEQIKKDVYISKLSELYAAKIYEEAGYNVKGPSFETTKKPDGGWDIVVDLRKINVKFLFKENIESGKHTRVPLKYEYDKNGGCEEYCLMVFPENLEYVEYEGSVLLSTIDHPENIPKAKNPDTQKIYEYFLVDWFRAI